MLLKGSEEEVKRWQELQTLTEKTERDIRAEMAKSANNWEAILEAQDEKRTEPFINQLLDIATDEELAALHLWTGGTYALINTHLRYGTVVDSISMNAAQKIESVLGRIQTPDEIIVRRGTGTKQIFEKMIGDWKSDPSVLIGQQFSDKGFVATSPLKTGGFSGVGESQCELFIRVPQGTHGAYIAQEAHNESEKEFLLQRGYSYRIIKAEYRSNPLFEDEKDLKVWCEVLPNE